MTVFSVTCRLWENASKRCNPNAGLHIDMRYDVAFVHKVARIS